MQRAVWLIEGRWADLIRLSWRTPSRPGPVAALSPAGAPSPVAIAPPSSPLEDDGLLLAVPKRKKSYSRKRMRQLERTKALKNLNNFYPCPNCDEGWLKLRHHLCVCAMKK